MTPSRVFARLEQNLRDWSRAPRENSYLISGAITKRCQEFEALIPDWCWITLIRYDLAQYWDTHHEKSQEVGQWRKVPFSSNGIDIVLLPLWLIRLVTFQFRTPAPQLKTGLDSSFMFPAVQRLRNLSHATKATDPHSLIAWVWTSFLSIGDREGAHHGLPTIDDLEKIDRFRRRTDDLFAELALRCAQRNWPNPESETSNRIRTLCDGLPKYQKKVWRRMAWERAVGSPQLAYDCRS